MWYYAGCLCRPGRPRSVINMNTIERLIKNSYNLLASIMTCAEPAKRIYLIAYYL